MSILYILRETWKYFDGQLWSFCCYNKMRNWKTYIMLFQMLQKYCDFDNTVPHIKSMYRVLFYLFIEI